MPNGQHKFRNKIVNSKPLIKTKILDLNKKNLKQKTQMYTSIMYKSEKKNCNKI